MMRYAFDKFNSCDLNARCKQIQSSYHDNGIVYLQRFLNETAIADLLNELERIHKDAEHDLTLKWNNQQVHFYSKNPANQKSPREKQEYVTEPYFLASGDKAHVFYEEPGENCKVNRIGHGMHLHAKYPHMHAAVYSNPVLNQLLQLAGLQKPVCQLSVYIPKYPEIGGYVRPHQESTFAYTEPHSVVVLWLALEDALIDNACMWGILGSNKWPLKYVSRLDHTARKRVFELLNEVPIPDFESERHYYTPLEVRAGDILMFHGNFVHASPFNHSNRTRKALSFQFIETVDTVYAATNWLQPPNNRYLYDLTIEKVS